MHGVHGVPVATETITSPLGRRRLIGVLEQQRPPLRTETALGEHGGDQIVLAGEVVV